MAQNDHPGKPRDGRRLRLRRFAGSGTPGLVLRAFPHPCGTPEPVGREPERRRTTDARHRKGANAQSQTIVETLAIIAYKQPVTKIEVDLIRGVKSQSSVDTLLNRGYIEEKGRLDKIGRPILYGTTNKFLRAFNISDLTELPKFQEFSMKEMTDINEIE